MEQHYREILQLLGLARRAGKISLGFDAVQESIVKKKSHLVIVAGDISQRTRSAVVRTAQQNTIAVILSEIPMKELGTAVGKLTGIISVNDEGFARKLKQLFA